MIVRVTEVDPICAMQACMDGYEVVSPFVNGVNDGTDECIDKALLANTDLLCSATGNVDVCNSAMLRALKSGAVVCNIGHFDNEIDTAYMRKRGSGKRSSHRFTRSTGTAATTTTCCFSLRADW